MPALIRQVALVSQSNLIAKGDVSKVAAAIQKQASRDLAPIWSVSATVDAFDLLDDVPIGYWPILVMDNIDQSGAAGIHEDRNGQPFALVTAAADIDEWSVTASHEALEMLVDPSGNRLVAGDSEAVQRRVNYLVEVSDPPEASDYAYSCNGVLVSDFYTPNYFDPMKSAGVRYSYTGAIAEPRQVLPGGYLSWQDPETGSWWQTTWFDGDKPISREIGAIDQSSSGNVRAVIDRSTMSQTARFIGRGRRFAKAAGFTAQRNSRSTSGNAAMWRDQVAGLLQARQTVTRDADDRAKVLIPGAQFDAPPAALGDSGAPIVQGAAFDSKQATLLGQFVGAAYTMYGNQPSDLTPPPSADFPPGYRLTASIQMRDFVLGSTDPLFYGFVAQDSANPTHFVLAFRGTANWMEWWDDANALGLTPFRVPDCGSVGAGFARIYDTIEIVEYPSGAVTAAAAPRSLASLGGLAQQMADLVSRHMPAPSLSAAFPAGATISVAGHSLGGALATLYVLENAKTSQVHNPLICTFASPRAGDSAFVAAFNALGLTSWRFANGPDVVPDLPPYILGFRHVDTLCALSSAGKVTPSVGCWHELATYLSLIDPTLQPSPECRLAPALVARRAPPAGAPFAAFEAPAPAPAAQPPAEDESVLAAAMTIVCPRVSQAKWLPALMAGFAKYGLSTDRRRAAAMGQFLVEAGAAFQEVAENLNYSAERAAQVFPSLFHTPEDAAPYAGNQVKFGNHVYANRLGNGNEASGDGYRFRGRGLIQLTGRSEYSDFGKTVGKTAEDVALYCESPEGAAVSGCWYLSSRGCLPFADAWNINKITLLVNGRAMLGAQQRLNYANAFLKHLGG